MQVAGYTITRCIAQGGMATVYLAEQTSLGRHAVLKTMDTGASGSSVALRRFLNEGRLIASIKHPHVVTIYDIGTAGGHVYISMEYVEGGDLKARLRDGPLPEHAALDIVENVASGLAAAHAQGIVHRDLKPGNILFRRDGTPLISDFGIAKSQVADGDLTATGVFLGSPNYMAPEQVEAGHIDGRADIYSLGIILYEMLTGTKPYQSNSVIDVIYMHRQAPLPRLPVRLAHLQELLDLMLAKDPAHRFRDAPALLHYLALLRQRTRAAAAAVPVSPAARRPTRIDWTGRQPRRRLSVLFALLAVALGAYAALFAVERHLALPVVARDPGTAVDLGALRAVADAPSVMLGTSASSPDPAAVRAALAWLGQHSLAEQRLTAPIKDNAFYYFSRLLALDPGNDAAKRGLRDIAASYARLAERSLVQGDLSLARSYVSIGRQIDPANEALGVLADLARNPSRGTWATIRDWFR